MFTCSARSVLIPRPVAPQAQLAEGEALRQQLVVQAQRAAQAEAALKGAVEQGQAQALVDQLASAQRAHVRKQRESGVKVEEPEVPL